MEKKQKEIAMKETPYPTLGECWHFIIDTSDLWDMFENKSAFVKALDRLAKEKDIDLEGSDNLEGQILKALKNILPDDALTDLTDRFVSEIFEMYRKVVLHEASHLDRKGTLEWFIGTYLISRIFLSLKKVQLCYRDEAVCFPDQPYWYLPVKQPDGKVRWPVGTVLDWWIELTGIHSRRKLSEKMGEAKGKGDNEEAYEKKFYRWSKNESLPKSSNIREISEMNFGLGDEEEKLKQSFVFNLLIARTVQSTFNKLCGVYGEETTRKWVCQFMSYGEAFDESGGKQLVMEKCRCRDKSDAEWHSVVNRAFAAFFEKDKCLATEAQKVGCDPNRDCESWLSKNQEVLIKKYGVFSVKRLADYLSYLPSPDEQFLKFLDIADFELSKKLTSLRAGKQEGDKDKAEKLIGELKTLEPYNERLIYYIHWNQGRHDMLMNNPKAAVKFYKNAFETGKYCAGESLKPIMQEGMLVAAKLNKKRLFKSMYKWALYYGLFSEPFDEVEAWLMDKQSKQFSMVFQAASRYPEAENHQKAASQSQWAIDLPEWENRKLDTRYPNREIKGLGPRPLTQLMGFSIVGQIDKVKKLLGKGADPKKRASDNSTALMRALDGGSQLHLDEKQREIANLLLDQDLGDSINAVSNRRKVSALNIAIEKADPEIVQKLVEKGADVNLRITVDDMTPLYFAINQLSTEFFDQMANGDPRTFCHPNLEMTKIARDYDAFMAPSAVFDKDYERVIGNSRIRMMGDSRSAEISRKVGEVFSKTAAENRDDFLKIIDVLIDAKADLEAKNTNDFTALMLASENGEFEVAKKLIGAGADVNAKGKDNANPLALALWKGHPEIAELILDGDDISKKTINLLSPEGLSAFQSAIQGGYANSVRKLIEKGANVSQSLPLAKHENGKMEMGTPLFMTVYMLSQKTTLRTELLQIMDMLIEHPETDLDAESNDFTPLMVASMNGAPEVYETVKRLIKAGADMNVKRKDGSTAFSLALTYKHPNTAELLLDNGYVPDGLSSKGSIILVCPELNLAAEKGYTQIVKKLS